MVIDLAGESTYQSSSVKDAPEHTRRWPAPLGGLSFGTTHRTIVLGYRPKRHPHHRRPNSVSTSHSGRRPSRTVRWLVLDVGRSSEA